MLQLKIKLMLCGSMDFNNEMKEYPTKEDGMKEIKLPSRQFCTGESICSIKKKNNVKVEQIQKVERVEES